MDEDTESPPEGDDVVTSPEDTDTTPEVPEKPKIKTVPYDSYKKKMDDNIRLNKRVKELEAGSRDSSGQTEAQRLQKQLDDTLAELTTVKTTLKDTQVTRQVETAARHLEFRDPEDALQLVRNRLEVDDDGNVLNAEELLRSLAKTKPYLLNEKSPTVPKTPVTPKVPPNGGTPANPPGAKQTIKSRDELKGLTPAQIMEKHKNGELDDLVKGITR